MEEMKKKRAKADVETVQPELFPGEMTIRETLEPLRTSQKGKSTIPGYVNRNRQMVIRKTDLPGTDHLNYVYELRCGDCRLRYGANGSEIYQRKCPNCQGGEPGLSL